MNSNVNNTVQQPSIATATNLSLEAVLKNFKHESNPAVNNISLKFKTNAFNVILGPSGCGKTTLLNIIAGITQPDSGKIIFSGNDITNLPTIKRNFGMVFQNYALFPNLTVAENIAYGLHRKAWSKKQTIERISELLALVQMQGESKRYPAELSGGQQQRVALARAMAPNPSVLLLDEPLSALDAKVRSMLGLEILNIQRKTNLTTIMVTHDQEEALALADNIILMREGCIEQQGTPYELYSNPATRFTAEFIGHMNFIKLNELNAEQTFGIRYEDIIVQEATERILETPYTLVAKILRTTLMGSFYRVELLLNDFKTHVYADIQNSRYSTETFTVDNLVAVTLPKNSWRVWD